MLEGLHEIEAGSLEKLTDKESHKRYMGTVFGWAAGELDRRMPAGPGGHDSSGGTTPSITRIAAAAAGGRSDAATVAVVSHGAAIRTWAGLRASNAERVRRPPCPRQHRDCGAWKGIPTPAGELIHWDGSPVGGLALVDPTAEDPTGGTL